MEKRFIEVSLAEIMQGSVTDTTKRVIGVAQIMYFDEGQQGTARISLTTGDHLYVKESYAEIKTLVGL